MLELEDARARILGEIEPLTPEPVPLREAAGRFLAEDFIAPLDLPIFDNSAMDGYAVRVEDVQRASKAIPARLRLVTRVPAGASPAAPLTPGTCARVFTGSPLPIGTDAVVMQEDVSVEGSDVVFHEPPKPWENIRFRGEDLKAGSVAVPSGHALGPGAIAVLGSLGVGTVAVRRKPVLGVLATGSELLEPGMPAQPGRIYESNRLALAALFASAGGHSRILPLTPDTLDETRRALQGAFDECDAVVTTGGVSVGEFDFVKQAFEALGGKLDFWKVAIKPGKPFVFGRLGTKLLFGLPGNPASALVTAVLLVRPAILRWQEAACVELPQYCALAAETFANRGDRRHFMRVRVDDDGQTRLAGIQASHAVGSLATANGLLDVPPETVIEKGAPVRVIRFNW